KKLAEALQLLVEQRTHGLDRRVARGNPGAAVDDDRVELRELVEQGGADARGVVGQNLIVLHPMARGGEHLADKPPALVGLGAARIARGQDPDLEAFVARVAMMLLDGHAQIISSRGRPRRLRGRTHALRRQVFQPYAAPCPQSFPGFGVRSARAQVEGLRALLAGAYVELHFVAFAQILEVNLGRKARAMKEDLVGAVVGGDEAEALVLDYLLDRAEHSVLRGAGPHNVELRRAGLYVKRGGRSGRRRQPWSRQSDWRKSSASSR